MQEAAQRVVDGFFEGGAVFVDLQTFVVAGFQREFRQPALAQAVNGADEQLVQPLLQAFNATEDFNEAVQPACRDRVQNEMAVDVVALAFLIENGAEAVGKTAVIMQHRLVDNIARGNHLQILAQRQQAGLHALLHLRRRLAGESGGDNLARLAPAFNQQAEDDAGERPGFAGTGGGFNQGAA